MGIFSTFFKPKPPLMPSRLYCIIGDPYNNPFRKYKEPRYETDPRHYGLDLLQQPVSDEEFDRKYRHSLHAFPNRDDALSCMCHCNIDSVMCPVYDRVGDEWVYNKEETSRLADAVI
jgi:hypothetical protein